MKYSEIIVHENYSASSKNKFNDIALIRLAEDVKFTPFVRPICLSTRFNKLSTGLTEPNSLQVAGWGETDICKLRI